MSFAAILLSVIVGTWNGNWFPSGRAEHRAHPDVEAATIAAAGKMIASGLAKVDPTGREDVILSLCEIRNRQAAEELTKAIGRKGLKVASVSAYRRRDRFDQQQNVILTTLPVAESKWARWTYVPEANPPRGYAMAKIVLSPAVTAAVYSVHLKANYGATTSAIVAANRAKRTHAINEFVRIAEGDAYAILAGDFNADKWRKEFAEETVFTTLEGAGYANLLELLPPKGRGTHPHKRYGDRALDYIMTKGFEATGVPLLEPNDQLSDHYAVFARVVPEEVRKSVPRPTRSARRPNEGAENEKPQPVML